MAIGESESRAVRFLYGGEAAERGRSGADSARRSGRPGASDAEPKKQQDGTILPRSLDTHTRELSPAGGRTHTHPSMLRASLSRAAAARPRQLLVSSLSKPHHPLVGPRQQSSPVRAMASNEEKAAAAAAP